MKEALNTAIECLNIFKDNSNGDPMYIHAIKVLETLAQPAQEPDAQITVEHYTGDFENITVDFCNLEKGVHLLYTAPQQSPWVDLTEDEMDKVRQSMGYNQFMSAGEYAKLVQFATQTKLKEKNA